ncbi:unannotated protein [freshwater metagenome]|uniref:Unannotated protein n=1 Tax=freshwater metagenome TaxID=449393 RepID=A0A6J6EK99_9ZZZZ
MHGRCRCVDKSRALKFTENCGDAPRTVNVFDVVLLSRRCNLADVRQPTTERVDVCHREIDFTFVGCSEDVQNGVGAATHSDVECHGVLERRLVGNYPGKYGVIVLLVVANCEIDDCSTRLQEQLLPIGMGRQKRSVTRK